MAIPYKLSKQEIERFRRDLSDCAAIKEDLDRAEMAGVPNVQHIREALQVCEDRINTLLATYNPKGKK